jgi:NTE family protein
VRRFVAVGSNLSRQLPEIFSAHHTPTLPLWQAMRASASFPIVFEPVTIAGSVFVDGGLTWNYPIDLFDGDFARRAIGPLAAVDLCDRTIGFVLGKDESSVADAAATKPTPIGNVREFANALIGFALDESTRLHTSADGLHRTVFIDTLGLSATDFGITEATRDQLVANGRAATEAFLARDGTEPAGGAAT